MANFYQGFFCKFKGYYLLYAWAKIDCFQDVIIFVYFNNNFQTDLLYKS